MKPLLSNLGAMLSKTGDGAGAGALTTSYTSGTAFSVKGASAIKVRLYGARGGASTGNTFRILDTSASANATIGAQTYPVRFLIESTGSAATTATITTDGGAETLLVNLGGVFETLTIQAKADAGPADAGDIAIAEVTICEGA